MRMTKNKDYTAINVTILLIALVICCFMMGMKFHRDVLVKDYSDAYGYTDRLDMLTHSDDEVIIDYVVDKCRSYSTLPDRMVCVNSFVTKNFNYVVHDDGLLYGATKLFTDGGMCIDYANFYCDMAEKFNYECAYGLAPEHVFAIVGTKDYYCDLDMKIVECYIMGDAE